MLVIRRISTTVLRPHIRRFLSCDKNPKMDEINRSLLTINNNLAVINYNTRICFYFSIINICVSIFC